MSLRPEVAWVLLIINKYAYKFGDATVRSNRLLHRCSFDRLKIQKLIRLTVVRAVFNYVLPELFNHSFIRIFALCK